MNTNNGWLDIASAPKDGTEILAWREDCGQFIASYTSADAFPMTQDELDAWDDETLFSKDWFTQWPHALRLEGSEAPTLWQPLAADPCATCNDQGAVGNILTAQPCPDCTPPASAQDSTEARTGNTAAEQAAYWRGFEEAQLNAQHNARVRAAGSTVADEGAKDERSDTYGMNLDERIAHVGGRTNAQGYTEFGSPMAVNALIQHVLRDIDWTRQDDDGGYQARYRLPGGVWSSWGHVVCGVKGHEQELRYLPGARHPAPAAGVLGQTLEFVREVSQQKPEKPDHWSSCGQCERNSSTAEDLLNEIAALSASQQGGE